MEAAICCHPSSFLGHNKLAHEEAACVLQKEIFSLWEESDMHSTCRVLCRVRVAFTPSIPGAMNLGADLLSTVIWGLDPAPWSRPVCIRRKCAVPLVPFPCHNVDVPLDVDALTPFWPPILLYAFPPLVLIPPTLSKVRDHRHTLILTAPHWPAMGWLAEIN